MPYNSGKPEDLRTALGATTDMARLLFAVAAGAVVLSVTFLEKVYVGHALVLLVIAWLLLGLSLLMGYISFGLYVSQLAESELLPRRTALEKFALAQFALAFVGLVLFAVFAQQNIAAGPIVELNTVRLLARDPPRLELDFHCRSGAGTGCHGVVRLYATADDRRPFASKLFTTRRDGASAVTLRLPRAAAARLRRAKHLKVSVCVKASGRFGNESTRRELLGVPRAKARSTADGRTCEP